MSLWRYANGNRGLAAAPTDDSVPSAIASQDTRLFNP